MQNKTDLTYFEEFVLDTIGTIERDNNKMYTGKTLALYQISLEITLSDDENIFNLPWEKQQKLIKEKFYKTFPYMKKEQ